MAKVYKTSSWRNDIQEIEITRQTDSYVWVKDKYLSSGERQELKEIKSERYFSTWEEAHLFLLDKIDDEICVLGKDLASAVSTRASICSMKPPRKEEG